MRGLSTRVRRAGAVLLGLVALVVLRTMPLAVDVGERLPSARTGQPLPDACEWVADLARPRTGDAHGAADGRGASNAPWAWIAAGPAAGLDALAAANATRLLVLALGALAAARLARGLGAPLAGAGLAATAWITGGLVGGSDLVGQPWLPLAAGGALGLAGRGAWRPLRGGLVLGSACALASWTTPGGGAGVATGAALVALAAGRTSRSPRRPARAASEHAAAERAATGRAATEHAATASAATASAGPGVRPAGRVRRRGWGSEARPAGRFAVLGVGLAVLTFVALRWVLGRALDGGTAGPAGGPGGPFPGWGAVDPAAVLGLGAPLHGVPRVGPAVVLALLVSGFSARARLLTVSAAGLAGLALVGLAPAAPALAAALLAAGLAAGLGVADVPSLRGSALAAGTGAVLLLAVSHASQPELELHVPPAVRRIGDLPAPGRVLYVPVREPRGELLVWEALAGRPAALARLKPRERERLATVAPGAASLARGSRPRDLQELAIDLDLLAVDHLVVDADRLDALAEPLDRLPRWERGPAAPGAPGWWYRRGLASEVDALDR